MNFGSQCQYHRSPRRRRLVRRPLRSDGRGRCGLYSAIMSATSSSEENPVFIRSAMNSWIRFAPDWSMFGTMSTSTTARAMPGEISPARSIVVNPPSDAPTSTGCGGSWRSTSLHVTGEADQPVVALVRPVRLAVAAEVDGDRLPTALGHRGGRLAPGATGLPAAVQEHHRRCVGIAESVGDDARAADTAGGERFRRERHVHSFPATAVPECGSRCEAPRRARP